MGCFPRGPHARRPHHCRVCLVYVSRSVLSGHADEDAFYIDRSMYQNHEEVEVSNDRNWCTRTSRRAQAGDRPVLALS
jgi:hypothetical protein